MAGNPALSQLKMETELSSVPVCVYSFGFGRQVRPFRPSPVESLSILRLNLVLLRKRVAPGKKREAPGNWTPTISSVVTGKV